MNTYEELDFRTYKLNEEGERILLANFVARILEETRIIDGTTTETILKLGATAANPDNKNRPIVLPEVEIQAQTYATMSWVMNAWGVIAVMQPGHGTKDDLRTAIQLNSRPQRKTIYRSIGWHHINGKPVYLHAKGAIGEKGNDASVTVRVPPELSRYDLTPKQPDRIKDAFLASVTLATLPPPKIGWTLWAGTFAPLFGPVDFAMHLSGRSGTYKSELVSLFQSHYGAEMDARHLPGSWSSTPNALEAQAYFAQNAPFAIDDFVPTGTSWQIRAYQTGADRLIRGQGNQAGRARLTDTSSMQATYYPRGIILSTGEDTPEGHSVRARMLINEISPGDIDPKRLTQSQKVRHLFPDLTAALIRYIAAKPIDLTQRTARLRDIHIKIGHTRTPPMLGRLIATGENVFDIARIMHWITEDDYRTGVEAMTAAIITAGLDQNRYLENADPVEIFFAALRQALGAGHGHIRTQTGGIPHHAPMLGWTTIENSGGLDTYKSHGPCIGWINWDDDTLYLDQDNGYAIVRKIAGQELSLTKQSVWKRLKDAGYLTRNDDVRQRNTVRLQAEGHQRQVVAIAATVALDTGELPNEDR